MIRSVLTSILCDERSDGFSFFTRGQVQCRHAVYTSVPTGDDDSMRKPMFAELVHPNPTSWDPGPTFSFCHPGSSPTPVLSQQRQPPSHSNFCLRQFLHVVLLWHLSYSLVPSGCSSVADGENRMVTVVCTPRRDPWKMNQLAVSIPAHANTTESS